MTTSSNGNNGRSVIDVISQMSGYGDVSASFAELLSGFNHRSIGIPLPVSVDEAGITFFTRPNFNLSYDNLAIDRVLTPLLTDNKYTYQRIIRTMLDPVGSGVNLYDQPGRGIDTPLFDSKNAFMPLLTNNLLSLTGWPDIAIDTYTSHEGILRENWSMVDGTSKTYTAQDLNATFRNVGGDPITLLLFVWATYMDHIHRGTMVPYLQSIVTNRVDYHTRMFRFTLDPSRMRIQKWASATGCFPIGVPLGASMNFSADNTYVQENADAISTTFRAQVIEYLDPIHFNEFNETVQMFNPEMADDVRDSYYTKIPYQYLRMFNYKGYPRVNVLTNELEWWMNTAEYEQMLANYTAMTQPMPIVTTNSPGSSPILTANALSAPPVRGAPYSVGDAPVGYRDSLENLQADQTSSPTDPLNPNSGSSDA